ncbi:MAG TPA: nuclear transport factor 2 family protein [Thermoanaerobaculia bacterium]|nr:nuclear transport factor 2 family protein [Thermoanaerobaculia bacterium]
MTLTRLLLCALFLVAVPSLAQEAPAAPEPEPQQVVDRFMDAYNRHDVEAMLALAHPDIQWLSVDGERISVEASGHEALRDSMTRYFASLPSAGATLEKTMSAGPYVSVVERARWKGDKGERSQAALAVYEIREGKVRRVWYYPVIP